MNKKILFLFLILSLFSCEFPLATPEEFCCKINGKRWTPTIKGTFGGKDTGMAEYYVKNGTFIIFGSSEDCTISMGIKFDPTTSLELNKKYLIETVLKLNQGSSSFARKSSTNSSQNIVVKGSSGYIKITKLDELTFSGTFEYDLEKKIESKTYKIRNGQFNNMPYSRYSN